jgi:phosphatidylserine/phosphatidylglycerophosphate/cardiolipin synthase-like enzyme
VAARVEAATEPKPKPKVNAGIDWRLQREIQVPPLGICLEVLDAVQTQTRALLLLALVNEESEVMLMGYTFDRSDLVEQLLIAQAMCGKVRVLLDETFTFGDKCRNTKAEVLRLLHGSVEMRSWSGRSCADVYREVGRSVASHIRGIQHSKVLRVDDYLIVGSCNWTTASRANSELGVLIKMNPDQIGRVERLLESRWEGGEPVRIEDVRLQQPSSSASQRTRSASAQRR